MTDKTTALKAQEQIVVDALIKYVELVSSIRGRYIEDLIDYKDRRPAFLVVASSEANDGSLFMSMHQLTPATLRQDHLAPLEMRNNALFGVTSVATAMAASTFKDKATDIIEVSEEIMTMADGVGHA